MVDEAPLSKPTKTKPTKKASKPASSATSAISALHSPSGLPNAQIDMSMSYFVVKNSNARRKIALVSANVLTLLIFFWSTFLDHPLETFKWPYSPFTSEFKEQHRARDKLAQDLRLAVQEIKGTNAHANRHLQDLDSRLQLSRQDLSTCLDEIQFRKSQLRDMSLMAVDIVKKLSRQPTSPSPLVSRPNAQDGAESDMGSVIPNTTGMSHVDHQMMDVDQESSGDDLSGSSHSPSLRGLNEGNVRSFLEKIRELEHTQRPLA